MHSKPEINMVIEARQDSRAYWNELWDYRELLLFLTLKDILVRYKQMVIGIAWSVLRPVIAMAVFTVVFGRIAHLPSEGQVPYALMVFAALLPWQLFSSALQGSSESVVSAKDLVTKVYFPRVIIPVSAVLSSMVDFLIAVAIFACLMVWYQQAPDWKIVALPFLVLQASLVALGLGLTASALNVSYRDFKYIVPFAIQFGLFLSPGGFSSTVVPDEWKLVYSLNPMVGVIDGFRWSLLGQDVDVYWPGVVLSWGVTFAVVIAGFWTFRRLEAGFSDRI